MATARTNDHPFVGPGQLTHDEYVGEWSGQFLMRFVHIDEYTAPYCHAGHEKGHENKLAA